MNFRSLDFAIFRQANLARLPLFKNALGVVLHPADGSNDWKPEMWVTALVGEVGEFANLYKKLVRGDFGTGSYYAELSKKLADELADVFCYLDLLANSLSIDLGGAVIEKFNEVSDRIGVNLTIASDGKSYHHPTSDFQVSKGNPLRPYCPACGSGSGIHTNSPPSPECLKVNAERIREHVREIIGDESVPVRRRAVGPCSSFVSCHMSTTSRGWDWRNGIGAKCSTGTPSRSNPTGEADNDSSHASKPNTGRPVSTG